jgi:hypothetical protein
VTNPPSDDGPPPAPAARADRPSAGSAPKAADLGGAQPRYLYVDGEGNLQFADRLEDIPARYRKEARSLAE